MLGHLAKADAFVKSELALQSYRMIFQRGKEVIGRVQGGKDVFDGRGHVWEEGFDGELCFMATLQTLEVMRKCRGCWSVVASVSLARQRSTQWCGRHRTFSSELESEWSRVTLR